ncbi:MAG TPA: protein-disulfide reductase DsbD domain-containing protein [Pyrinomonadaceae bacterium]|nr:protein-disulfide reductase DsbD domain-containing protein [Pyrinomonadaceae bacterium]
MPRLNQCAPALLCLLFAFSGCKNSSAPVASSTPAPKEVSSSDQVVKAFTHFIPSASPQANIELVVTPGYHINANPATAPYLIATEVQPGKVEDVTVAGKLTYPPPKMETFTFSDQPLAVYEGSVTVPIPLMPAAGAKGQRTIPFKIRVQACDSEKCFPPASLDAALPVDLDALKR